MEKFLGSITSKVEEKKRQNYVYVLGIRRQVGSRGIFGEDLRYSIREW